MDALLEPLVMDATEWASQRERELDIDLLVLLLDLRLVHDQMGDAYWPAGSVRHLMAVRLPQHGPVELPEASAVVSTLDAYWRFLRTTGRMSAASAPVADLIAEARKARREMDRASVDADAIRRRQAHAAHRERLDSLVEPAPADRSAADFRESGLWHDLAGLLARIGDGLELAVDGLPVEVAHELYDTLGQGQWMATLDEVAALAADPEVDPNIDDVVWDENWQTQGDALPIDRLWWTAVRAELVVVDGDRAVVDFTWPADDEGWRALGVACLTAQAEWFAFDWPVAPLVMTLVLLDDPLAPTRSLDELVEQWLTEVAALFAELGQPAGREQLVEAADQVLAAIAMFDDAGVWVREGRDLSPTAFGHDVAAALAEADRQGLLEPLQV